MGLENIIDIIAKVEFFSICDDEQLRLLAFSSEIKHYNSGDTIVDENIGNDGAYIIIDGIISICDDLKLKSNSYFVSAPNVLIGESALLLNKPLRCLVTANNNVEALFIPSKAFYKLLQQYPKTALFVKQRIENQLDNYLHSFDVLR